MRKKAGTVSSSWKCYTGVYQRRATQDSVRMFPVLWKEMYGPIRWLHEAHPNSCTDCWPYSSPELDWQVTLINISSETTAPISRNTPELAVLSHRRAPNPWPLKAANLPLSWLAKQAPTNCPGPALRSEGTRCLSFSLCILRHPFGNREANGKDMFSHSPGEAVWKPHDLSGKQRGNVDSDSWETLTTAQPKTVKTRNSLTGPTTGRCYRD